VQHVVLLLICVGYYCSIAEKARHVILGVHLILFKSFSSKRRIISQYSIGDILHSIPIEIGLVLYDFWFRWIILLGVLFCVFFGKVTFVLNWLKNNRQTSAGVCYLNINIFRIALEKGVKELIGKDYHLLKLTIVQVFYVLKSFQLGR